MGKRPTKKLSGKRNPRNHHTERGSNHRPAILTILKQIPRGHVATYGQVASLAGVPKNARQVGAILRSLPVDSDVPWFRIVNAQGDVAARGSPDSESFQRRRLALEGVQFDRRGRVLLQEHQWIP